MSYEPGYNEHEGRGYFVDHTGHWFRATATGHDVQGDDFESDVLKTEA